MRISRLFAVSLLLFPVSGCGDSADNPTDGGVNSTTGVESPPDTNDSAGDVPGTTPIGQLPSQSTTGRTAARETPGVQGVSTGSRDSVGAASAPNATGVESAAPLGNAAFDQQLARLQQLQQAGKFLEAKVFIRSMQRQHRRHPRARELDRAMTEIRELMREIEDLRVAINNLRSDDTDIVRASQELLRQGDEAARILLRQTVREGNDVGIRHAVEVLVDMSDPQAPTILAAKLKEHPDGPLNQLLFDALSNLTETTDGAVLAQSYQLLATWQDHYAAAQSAAADKAAADEELVVADAAAELANATAARLADEAARLIEVAIPFEETAAAAEQERLAAKAVAKTADGLKSQSTADLKQKTLAAEQAKAAATAAAADPRSTDTPVSTANTAAASAKGKVGNLKAALSVANDAKDKSLAAVIKAVQAGDVTAIQKSNADLKLKVEALALAQTSLDTALVLQTLAEQHLADVTKATVVAKKLKVDTARASTDATVAQTAAQTKATADAKAATTAATEFKAKTTVANTAKTAAEPHMTAATAATKAAQEAHSEADAVTAETEIFLEAARVAATASLAADGVLAGNNDKAVMGAAAHLCYALGNSSAGDAEQLNELVGKPDARQRLHEFILWSWKTAEPDRLAWCRKHIGLTGFLLPGARARYLVKDEKVMTDAQAVSQTAAAEATKAAEAATTAATAASTAMTAANTAMTLFKKMQTASDAVAATAETATAALVVADAALADAAAELKDAQVQAASADTAAKAAVENQTKTMQAGDAAAKAAQAKALPATLGLTTATQGYAAKLSALAAVQAQVKDATLARTALKKSAEALATGAKTKVVADAALAAVIKANAAAKTKADAKVTATATAATAAKAVLATKMTAATAATTKQTAAAAAKKAADEKAVAAAKVAADTKVIADTKTAEATKAKQAALAATEAQMLDEAAAKEASYAAERTQYVFTKLLVERRDPRLQMLDGQFPHPDPEFKRENLALHWSGLIDVPGDGEYTFWSRMNDFIELHIDGKRYSVTGAGNHQTKYKLTPGLHDIDVYYRDLADGYYCTISWQGPGIDEPRIISGGDIYTPGWKTEEDTTEGPVADE